MHSEELPSATACANVATFPPLEITDDAQDVIADMKIGDKIISEKLPTDIFVRIHRSYVVNREKIDAIQKNKINIQSQVLPIGKLYKHSLSFPG